MCIIIRVQFWRGAAAASATVAALCCALSCVDFSFRFYIRFVSPGCLARALPLSDENSDGTGWAARVDMQTRLLSSHFTQSVYESQPLDGSESITLFTVYAFASLCRSDTTHCCPMQIHKCVIMKSIIWSCDLVMCLTNRDIFFGLFILRSRLVIEFVRSHIVGRTTQSNSSSVLSLCPQIWKPLRCVACAVHMLQFIFISGFHCATKVMINDIVHSVCVQRARALALQPIGWGVTRVRFTNELFRWPQQSIHLHYIVVVLRELKRHSSRWHFCCIRNGISLALVWSPSIVFRHSGLAVGWRNTFRRVSVDRICQLSSIQRLSHRVASGRRRLCSAHTFARKLCIGALTAMMIT